MQNTLTVKWVTPDGNAVWYPANIVSARADESSASPPPGAMGFITRVEFDNGDGTGVRVSIDSGTVYIMNAAGKTIDAIHLGVLPGEKAQAA